MQITHRTDHLFHNPSDAAFIELISLTAKTPEIATPAIVHNHVCALWVMPDLMEFADVLVIQPYQCLYIAAQIAPHCASLANVLQTIDHTILSDPDGRVRLRHARAGTIGIRIANYKI